MERTVDSGLPCATDLGPSTSATLDRRTLLQAACAVGALLVTGLARAAPHGPVSDATRGRFDLRVRGPTT